MWISFTQEKGNIWITIQKKAWTQIKSLITVRAETLLCSEQKLSQEVTPLCLVFWHIIEMFHSILTTDLAHCPIAEAWQRTDKNPRSLRANWGRIRCRLWLTGFKGKLHHSLRGWCVTFKMCLVAGSIRCENGQYKINNSFTPLLLFRVTETIQAHTERKAGKHDGGLNR